MAIDEELERQEREAREREEREAREERAQAERLTDDLAKKYDPERLLKIVSKRAGRGDALEHSVRSKYERRLGVDLSHVRVYSGEFAEEFNRQHNAYATTIGGTGMVLLGGSPDKAMHTAQGQALLAHELTHVAQQGNAGIHRKAMNMSLPFTQEHEVQAEAVEASVLAEANGASRALAKMRAQVRMQANYEAKMEEVKERVLELAAEAERSKQLRTRNPRRA